MTINKIDSTLEGQELEEKVLQQIKELEIKIADTKADKVFETIIPRSVKISESPSHGMPIHLYDPKSKGAETYHRLAEELIYRSGMLEKGGLVLLQNEIGV